jgi:RNA polymerase sigma factor (sigma-70 family)
LTAHEERLALTAFVAGLSPTGVLPPRGEKTLAPSLPRDADGLGQFLATIPRGPLLTAAQEWALARRVRGEDVRVPPPGDARPTAAEARDRLVTENLRLVVSVARRYSQRGVPLDDLIQEGAIGLQHAIAKFDPDRGWRFATYATWWVRQAVARAAVDNARVMRIPAPMVTRQRAVDRAGEVLVEELGRAVSAGEIGNELGLSERQVCEALASERDVRWLGEIVADASPLADLIGDASPGPEALVELTDLGAQVEESILGGLGPRERHVLSLRHGIGCDRPCTLQEIGDLLSLSRERVRQIEDEAVARLRRDPSLRSRFAEYLPA